MVTVDEAVRSLIQRDQREIAEEERRIQRWRALVPDAASLLRKLGARRVILFGSLAGGTPHRYSDVDLAVEGLPADEWSNAYSALCDLFGTEYVDLVELERAPEALKAMVAQYGEAADDGR